LEEIDSTHFAIFWAYDGFKGESPVRIFPAPPKVKAAIPAPPEASTNAAVAAPVAAVAATGEPSPGAENAEMGPP